MRTGQERLRLGWMWLGVVILVLVSATLAPAVWHGGHGAEQDCAICQLRHHTVADLTVSPPVRPLEAPELVASGASVWHAGADRAAQVPARAPPA